MIRLTRGDVLEAAQRIAGVVARTPILRNAAMDAAAGRSLVFKCEHLQTTGSFKYRGATSAVLQLDACGDRRPVVAYSTGNHAQALALAASRRGVAAHLVVPHTIPPFKLAAIRRHGGRVRLCEPGTASLAAAARAVVHETGGVLISSSENPFAIAGQGTAVLELLQQAPDLDAVICPAGSGGLLAGSCIAADGPASRVEIFGAEPAGADDTARSYAAGELVRPATPPTSMADGLLVDLAVPAWDVIRRRAAGIVRVSEEEIQRAMRLVWERMRVRIEPSAAVAVAAALSCEFRQGRTPARVGIVLSGGNVSAGRFAALLDQCESACFASSR
jgi:threonine dehydratase/serine racemase